MCTELPSTPPSRPRRAPVAGPFVLGLVGPAGSGKSAIAHALAAAGAQVLDADGLGHEVTSFDPEVRAALVAEYGPEVYGQDGTLDRRRVAASVFTDPAALHRLNQLVHPRIIVRLRDGISAATRAGFTGLLVIDAALMLDWNLERECDAVLAVIAPPEQQLARLVAKRGWTEEQARQRLANARSNDEFALLADEVVQNAGSEAAAERAAEAAVARLRERHRRGEA